MPITTIRDPGNSFAIQEVTESLEVDEVLRAQRSLYLSPGHNPQQPVLWDARNADLAAGFSEIFRMVEDSTGLWHKMAGGRTAILVGSARDASVARMYKKLAEAMPRELAIFTCYDEAVSWLCADYSPASASASAS